MLQALAMATVIFLRCVHGRGKRAGQQRDQRREHRAHEEEHHHTGADDLSALFALARADLLTEQDSRAHSKGAHKPGDGLHDLRAHRHAGHVLRQRVLAHHQQIHRAVERLQKQGQQNRHRERQQRPQDRPFGKILDLFLFHDFLQKSRISKSLICSCSTISSKKAG